MMALSPPRVLSFAGNVVHGFCAHKTTTYVLQLLGLDIDPVDCFLYCNHRGYPKFQGIDLSSEGFASIVQGLRDNDLLDQTHVMTGIYKSSERLMQTLQFIKELKETNSELIYVCDPALGDGRQQYFAGEDLAAILAEKALPLADVVLPNQSEAEWLTDMRIESEADALAVINRLHALGPRTVVITSTDFATAAEGMLYGYASSDKDGEKHCYRIKIPKLEAQFYGPGDLFGILWLFWSIKHPEDMKLICEKVASTLRLVLKRTQQAAIDEAGPDTKPTVEQLTLRLIESKRDIENPKICVDVERIN